MKKYDVNIFPFVTRMLRAKAEDRLDIGISYVDNIIKQFNNLGARNEGRALIRLLRDADVAWAKMSRQEIHLGDEDTFSHENFREIFAIRMLDTSRNEKQRAENANSLDHIYKGLGWGGLFIKEVE